jgi:hypothetical protein
MNNAKIVVELKAGITAVASKSYALALAYRIGDATLKYKILNLASLNTLVEMIRVYDYDTALLTDTELIAYFKRMRELSNKN